MAEKPEERADAKASGGAETESNSTAARSASAEADGGAGIENASAADRSASANASPDVPQGESASACASAKAALRKRFKEIRRSLGEDARHAADEGIAERVVALPEWRRAQVVLSYLAFGSEVETRGIIEAAWRAGKVVALPRCVPGTRNMTWHRVESLDGLVRSPHGVDEPPYSPATQVDAESCSPEQAIALVPGLAFDVHGYRLGYGGGFYDVFLAGFPGHAVGLCREAQLAADLRSAGAVDAHDILMPVVVTEARTIRAHDARQHR